MKLKRRRSQKRSGMFKDAIFLLDIEIELTPDERQLVEQYNLSNGVVYEKEEFGIKIKLRELLNGKHFECRGLNEMLGMEREMIAACHHIRRYLTVARSFDGAEDIIEITEEAA